jgi:fumarate hydratase subunit beta
MISLQTPLLPEQIINLHVGERCLITGDILTARDAAHARLVAALARGEQLPFDLKGQLIYYVGPCRANPGEVIGSAGPTTSGRMDPFMAALLEHGLAGSIGKGRRNRQVKEAMRRHGAVYLAATGGAGALLAQTVRRSELLLYPELGPEAVYRLRVVDFPVVVAIDSSGDDLYEIGPRSFANRQE